MEEGGRGQTEVRGGVGEWSAYTYTRTAVGVDNLQVKLVFNMEHLEYRNLQIEGHNQRIVLAKLNRLHFKSGHMKPSPLSPPPPRHVSS